jgi:hypothetical protein
MRGRVSKIASNKRLSPTPTSRVEFALTAGNFVPRIQRTAPGISAEVECVHGEFGRSFRLPELIEPASATATYDEGVLQVIIPKTRHAPRTVIEIRAANHAEGKPDTVGGYAAP